jgi:phosphate:Na+ symporter
MIDLLQILGGLSLFLFGIRMLSSGMEKLTGDQIQKWLDKMTSRLLTSALFGTVATALIHSSGLLMVTMIGLINANLMTVEQAIGVMLGQEIGTTLTAQIVAFKIGNFNMLFVILGVIFFEFFENREWKKYGEISFGIGIVFLGMTLMSSALSKLVQVAWVGDMLAVMGQYPLAGVLAGIIVTATVQSSTAVTSIAVAMGMSNVITLEGAVGIILGANIGSCVTGLIASLQLSAAARQASLAQILINAIGVALFLPFIAPYSTFIKSTSVDLARQIANAHTIFNVIVSLLLFPFVKQIAAVSRWLVPEQAKKPELRLTAYIDAMQASVPAVALNEASRELVRLGGETVQMLEKAHRALIDKDIDKARDVIAREDNFVDPVYKATIDFVNNLIVQEDLTAAQKKRCFQLKNLLMDIERIGDMAQDIAQYAMERVENDVTFTEYAIIDMEKLAKQAIGTYTCAIQAFETSDKVMAKQACHMESEFDLAYWKARQEHINRLQAGICKPEANVIFTEVLRILERISDHADNLGVSVMRS